MASGADQQRTCTTRRPTPAAAKQNDSRHKKCPQPPPRKKKKEELCCDRARQGGAKSADKQQKSVDASGNILLLAQAPAEVMNLQSRSAQASSSRHRLKGPIIRPTVFMKGPRRSLPPLSQIAARGAPCDQSCRRTSATTRHLRSLTLSLACPRAARSPGSSSAKPTEHAQRAPGVAKAAHAPRPRVRRARQAGVAQAASQRPHAQHA